MARTEKHRSNATPPKYGRFKQAVRERGFSYTTMRDAHYRGELAVIKIGKAWYVELAELDRFAERHTERLAG